MSTEVANSWGGNTISTLDLTHGAYIDPPSLTPYRLIIEAERLVFAITEQSDRGVRSRSFSFTHSSSGRTLNPDGFLLAVLKTERRCEAGET